MKTADVNNLIRARFCAPEWATFFEVSNGTGGGAGRYADAIAMNLYPSRGLAVHGFEVKVSRGDWQRELKQPDKSAAIQRFCDYWWIVAPKGIVQAGELPPTWGLYEVDGRGMRCVTKAPKLDAEPISRHFFASLARAASTVGDRMQRAIIDTALQKERDAIQRRIDEAVKFKTRELDELKASVKQFEDASGLTIDRWYGGKEMGIAVKLVRELGIASTYGGVKSLADQCRKFAERVDTIMPQLAEVEADDV